MDKMKHSVETRSSRRRSLLLILLVVLICLGVLGYIYNFSRTNRLLIQKHETLTLSFQTCQKQFDKCADDRQALVTTGEKLQELEKQRNKEQDAKKLELSEIQIKLETKTTELTDLQSALEKKRASLNDTLKALEKSENKLRDLDKVHLEILDAVNITNANISVVNGTRKVNMTPALGLSIVTKIIRLKASNFEHLELKEKYGKLLHNHNKLYKKKGKASFGTEKTSSSVTLSVVPTGVTKGKASLDTEKTSTNETLSVVPTGVTTKELLKRRKGKGSVITETISDASTGPMKKSLKKNKKGKASVSTEMAKKNETISVDADDTSQ